MRNEYVEKIKEPIEKLGFKIVKDVNPDDDKKEILKEFSKKMSEQQGCLAEFLEIVNKEYWNLLY